MHSDSNIFIVIPVHNRKTITLACLEALARQTARCFHVVVVDDGSTDGTAVAIAQQFPIVTVLRGDGNLWWSGATNLGVKHALMQGAAYILTLNDDTRPLPDYIEKMLYWIKIKPQAILGSLGLDANTLRPIYGGERINWWTAGYESLLKELPVDQQVGLHPVTHFPGRGLLIPSEVFRKVGLYDARRFPQAVADEDFTHRAVRAGFQIFCNYDAKILVPQGVGVGEKLRLRKSWRNYWLFLTDRHGYGNLKYFILYAWRNCPWYCLPAFLSVGCIRRIGGYLLEWSKEKVRSWK